MRSLLLARLRSAAALVPLLLPLLFAHVGTAVARDIPAVAANVLRGPQAATAAPQVATGAPAVPSSPATTSGSSLPTCTPQPLLWVASKANRTAYLIGTYRVPAQGAPIPLPVQQALACTDVAYFELACALTDNRIGNYLAHCNNYSIADPEDSISMRLPQQDLVNLEAAVNQFLTVVPSTCAAAKVQLLSSLRRLNDTNSRMTLRTFYHQALQVLNTRACQLEAQDTTAGTHEDALRSRCDGRPIFGLRDISAECALYQGNGVDKDVLLSRRMANEVTDEDWTNSMSEQQAAMIEVMQCGNLETVTQMRVSGAELPWLREKLLARRNPALARAIERAWNANPGKVIAAAVNVVHFVELNGTTSMVGELIKAGFTVERFTGASLACEASAYKAPGAKELNQCLYPPGRAQPASCDNFTRVFAAAMGQDKNFGRNRSDAECKKCVNSSAPCTCNIEWYNDTNFKELCMNTAVGDVRGHILEMDLTRNSGSRREGPELAEKTVRGLKQNCYATSCRIPLLKEMALRNWYKHDPTLAGGDVVLRYPGGQSRRASALLPVWAWVAALLGVVVLIAALVGCFLVPKKNRVTRNSDLDDGLMDEPDFDQNYQKVEDGNYPPMGDTYQQGYNQGGFNQGIYDVQGVYGYNQQPSGLEERPPSPDRVMRPQEQELQPPPWQGQAQQQVPAWPPDPMPPPNPWAQTPQSPERAPPGSMQVFDNSLLNQALQMQQMLGDAGAQAVQQMQFQALQGMQNPGVPGGGSPGGGPMQPMPMSSGPSMPMPGWNPAPTQSIYEPLPQYNDPRAQFAPPMMPGVGPMGYGQPQASPMYMPLAQGDGFQRQGPPPGAAYPQYQGLR